MHIFYEGGDAGLEEATEIFTKYFHDGELWDQLLKLEPFTQTNVNVEQIINSIRSCPNNIELVHFTPQTQADIDFYEVTYAYVDGGHPHKIFYHTKFLGNSVVEKLGTLFHELVHVVDLWNDGSSGWDFGHGLENGEDPLESAPYEIGYAVERYHKGEPILESNKNKSNKSLQGSTDGIARHHYCGTAKSKSD